jgi:adenylate cyclase
VEAGLELLAATRHGTDEPSISVGIDVNTGVAYRRRAHRGARRVPGARDEVNITARLATAAGTGELVVTEAAVRAAGFPDGSLPHRTVALKGKAETMTVAVVTVAIGVVPAASRSA